MIPQHLTAIKKSVICIALSLAVAIPASPRDHTTNPDSYFLTLDRVADSLGLLPPPPVKSSARFAYDREQYEWGKSLRGTDRGAKAVSDADLSRGWVDRAFSEAFGFRISPETTPQTYKLITNMMEDAGDLATRSAKQHYMRVRPFVEFGEPSATPGDEAALRANGSYPSGHTSIGWATALVLAEVNPARQQQILERGFEFGQSRVIVGAHYQSDVDAGRVVGAGVVASLHADKNFARQLEKAKKEIARLNKKAANK